MSDLSICFNTSCPATSICNSCMGFLLTHTEPARKDNELIHQGTLCQWPWRIDTLDPLVSSLLGWCNSEVCSILFPSRTELQFSIVERGHAFLSLLLISLLPKFCLCTWGSSWKNFFRVHSLPRWSLLFQVCM